ncbi:MAG: zinc ribbon domain-containing protein, partial [Clostridia bacterium]|nr:zinc ribbon domain-containing protein [Clostridia bacterium]
MALKRCPMCFKEIPEESRVCSHCGTELKKCPKCETLAIKETETCSRCGARFTSGILIEDPEVSVRKVV